MNDLWMIAATLGFFALCAAYVALCDRIVGPDEIESPTDEPPTGSGVGSADLVTAQSGVTEARVPR